MLFVGDLYLWMQRFVPVEALGPMLVPVDAAIEQLGGESDVFGSHHGARPPVGNQQKIEDVHRLLLASLKRAFPLLWHKSRFRGGRPTVWHLGGLFFPMFRTTNLDFVPYCKHPSLHMPAAHERRQAFGSLLLLEPPSGEKLCERCLITLRKAWTPRRPTRIEP